MSIIFKINDKILNLDSPITQIKTNSLKSQLLSSMLYGLSNRSYILKTNKANFKDYVDDLWFTNICSSLDIGKSENIHKVSYIHNEYTNEFNLDTFIEYNNINDNYNRISIYIPNYITTSLYSYSINRISDKVPFPIIDFNYLLKSSKGLNILSNLHKSYFKEFMNFYNIYFKNKEIRIEDVYENPYSISIENNNGSSSIYHYPIDYIYTFFVLFSIKKTISLDIPFLIIDQPEIYYQTEILNKLIKLLSLMNKVHNIKIIIFNKKVININAPHCLYEI